jgi:hypothetical protein
MDDSLNQELRYYKDLVLIVDKIKQVIDSGDESYNIESDTN